MSFSLNAEEGGGGRNKKRAGSSDEEMPGDTFELLVERWYEPLYRFALSLCHSEAEAWDLTQQTFFRWATKGHQLRDKSKAKTWLFTTLYREYLAQHRRITRFPHQNIEDLQHKLESESYDTARALDAGIVLQTLQEVDEIYRAPLTLFYMEEHSYQEIAHILDVPIGTVMSRLSRGKRQLRLLLKKKEESGPQSIINFEQKKSAP